MTEVLRDAIARNRAGEKIAVPSVCCAHPEVLRASLMLAEQLDRHLIVEATSNQVNQDGGYTGMQPADFVAAVHRIAEQSGVDRQRLTFGGDHLGPQAWRSADAKTAMAKAEVLVASYVRAGIRKIHIDCSEGCLSESAQLPDEVTATRASRLARVATEAAENPDRILFVVGTEVPPPGGAKTDKHGHIVPTRPESAAATIAAHQEKMKELWRLVGGLVVQPGVEFAPAEVHHFPIDSDPGLRQVMSNYPGLGLEAHSTDYQQPQVYPRLAELGFVFQKVGPALTHAWRQAVYALDHLLGSIDSNHQSVITAAENAMLANPAYWSNHYQGENVQLMRHFGLSDRIRYYWTVPQVQKSVQNLFARFRKLKVPQHVFTEYFAEQTLTQADHIDLPRAQALALAQVQRALLPYFF